MNHSFRLARASGVRSPLPTAIALLVILAQATACQPETTPDPDNTPPEQPDTTPQVQTSPFSLAASSKAPDTSTEVPQPGIGAFIGVLTPESTRSDGAVDFRYDAYVVTARESGTVVIQGEVIDINVDPKGYRNGYGFPLSMTTIEDGVSLTSYGGSYLQNALETGTAIIDYPVVKGHQYILVYKTFGGFTPQTYRLKLPISLIVEGRIYMPPTPVPIPPISEGLITLENPRPDVLSSFVPWLSSRVNSN
jgi:hypothetical protein